MPTPEDILLVSRLFDSTERGKVNWQKTAVQDQFAAAFGGKWTVLIDRTLDNNRQYFWLGLNNSQGDEILRITASEDSRIVELFEIARRRALKVDEALVDLFKELGEP